MDTGELLSKDFLQSIGINLDAAEYTALSDYYFETLSKRIVDEILNEIDDDKLSEFSRLRSGDAAALWEWLRENVPTLEDIIEDEVAILLGEIAENSSDI